MPPQLKLHENNHRSEGSVSSVSIVAEEEESYSRSKSQSKEESEQKLKLAQNETNAVFRLRLLVFFVLLLAATAVSIIVYFITINSEDDNYRTQYDAASKLVLETFVDIAENKLGAVSALGVALTAHGVHHSDADWPFVTLSSFQQRAFTALKQSEALYVHVNPIVSTEHRETWEQFVLGEDATWIQEGIEYQESIGIMNFLPNNASSKEENRLQHPPHDNETWPMWYHDAEGETHVDRTKGPYLPTWQTSPVVYEGSDVNENIFSSFRTEAPEVSFSTNSVVISEFLISPSGGMDHQDQHTAIYSLLMSIRAQENTEYEGDALSQAFFPIYDSFQDDRRPVAVMVAWIHWRNYFLNILPDSLRGVYLVLSDGCGDAYTYSIYGGEVINVGRGDLHDRKFDDQKRTINYNSVKNIADGTKFGLPLNEDFCDITLDVYPSAEFQRAFVTATPIVMTVAVAAIFVFTALMFLVYDRLVERRQALVMKRAMDTNTVLASLFPEQVRERLIEASNKERDDSSKRHSFTNQNHRLKGYLKEGKEGTDTAPIAELYPSCTVLFADIAGFTAWSSTREPAQVFILLQTVYQAFDAIAKRRKVFKVETIGDSYLAVAGLPEPMDNHATAMARFAWDCLNKMHQVTRDLEVTLGPDTCELSIRVGLHSGPVTAGVLQGERARFQLFGDTVNTASRMESTGQRGRIQVSKDTADLLEANGKSSWLRQREDVITAKGKGSMQTWWVNPSPRKGSSQGSGSGYGTGHEDITESAQENEGKEARVQKKPTVQNVNHRLVSWIVELLMDDVKRVVHARHLCRSKESSSSLGYHHTDGSIPLDEVQTKLHMPPFNARVAEDEEFYRDIDISEDIVNELRHYVTTIASMYRDNPFHNFEHACHVTMSVKKLLRRIAAPNISDIEDKTKVELANCLHDYTFGINSDPLTSLAITFSALIHDVDHRGVSNFQLINEAKDLADKYNNKCIAEQNSLDIAWDLLQRAEYKKLRSCLFASHSEMMRFRQLIINVVLATDIFDKELNDFRKTRWECAFKGARDSPKQGDSDLKATIVIEHIIQASDVSHTMQHWHVYQKWNKCLFKELFKAYREGRMGKDPATFWYQGEIGFFDNYVIPLAKKLKDCGVFGVSGDEYLNYALQNRMEWKERGEEIVAGFVEDCKREEVKRLEKEGATNQTGKQQ